MRRSIRRVLLRTISIMAVVLAVGVALSRATALGQNIYFTNYDVGTIGEYTISGAVLKSSLVSGLGIPEGIAVSGSNLFVVNYGAGTIGEYNATTGATVNASLVSGLSGGPQGIAVSGSNLFVTNYSAGTIGEYTASGATVNASLVSGLNAPWGIAVSGSNLFVVNFGAHTIGEYNATTGATVNASLVSGLNGEPENIAVSGSNLFVTNEAAGTIGEYNATTGATVNASLVSGLSNPVGIAAAGSNLFVVSAGNADGYGTIGEYNATTGATVNASLVSGLSAEFGIAVQAASAPGTIALSNSSVILRAMRSSATATAVTLSETSGTSMAGFSSSLSGAATISPSTGTLAAGSTESLNLGWNSYASTGPLAGTVTLSNTGNPFDPFNSSGNVISMTGAVVDNRIVTASTANFGVFHVGTTTAASTTTLSTTGDDNYFTRVTVATTGGSGNFLVTGGTGTLFNSAASGGSRTLSGTFSAAGNYSGSVTLITTGEGLPGESPQNVLVPYSVQVFSGSGSWAGNSGSWSANGNWMDSNGSGVQAAPGTWGYNDTATFSGLGSVTAIDLTGANPSLNALSFSNSSYTLSNGSLTLNGSSGTATVTVSSGTQSINTPVTLANNANFAVNGGALLLNSTISGSGTFTKSGSAGLTLAGADTLSSTGSIAITQGTLTAPLGIPHAGGGITLAGGATLQAAGQINRAVVGAGTVTATSELFIGNATQSGQFNQGGSPGVGGTLNVGGNAVAIFSADTAILGSQTNLGPGGSLTALNGAQLGNATTVDATKVLTATGNATINGNFVNNGVVNGPTGSGQELKFTQAVQGAGSTTGNIEYAGSYHVGNSPDAVPVQNVLFDPTSTLIMEFAGDVPGSGYDQLEISGLATLNGTLDLSMFNGYSLDPSHSYEIINGPTTGQFAEVTGLPSGWQVSYSADGVTVVSSVPEPSTFALLAAGAIALAGYGWRKRRVARTAKPAAFDQQDAPTTLLFPSRSTETARRAA